MARLLLVEQISVSSPESEKAKSLGPSLGRILQSFRFVLEKLQSQSPLRGLAQICSIWEEQTPKKNPNLWKSLTRCQQQQIDLGSVFRICPGVRSCSILWLLCYLFSRRTQSLRPFHTVWWAPQIARDGQPARIVLPDSCNSTWLLAPKRTSSASIPEVRELSLVLAGLFLVNFFLK